MKVILKTAMMSLKRVQCQHIKITEHAWRKCLNSLSSRFYPEYLGIECQHFPLHSPTSPPGIVSINSCSHLSMGFKGPVLLLYLLKSVCKIWIVIKTVICMCNLIFFPFIFSP